MVRAVEGQPKAQVARTSQGCGSGEATAGLRTVGMGWSAVILAVAMLFGTAGAHGDRVRLTNGRTLEGVVRDLGSSIEVTLSFGGTVVLHKSAVLSIERTAGAREEYLKRAARTGTADPDAQVTLGRWCRENGLERESKQHFERALLLDPRHRAALRELGYLDLEDRWPSLPPGWESVTSRHFVVSSPLSRSDARAIADDLELFFAEFERAFSGNFVLRPVKDPIQVRLYQDDTQFAEVVRKEFKEDVNLSARARTHLDGFADPKRRLIVVRYLSHLGPRNRETLFHESTHMLVHLMLEEGKRITASTPEELERIREMELAKLRSGKGLMWFHEGLANYYGASCVRDGKFVAGAYLEGGQSSRSLAWVKEAIRQGKALSLDQVADGQASDFLGERFDLYYSQAWLFVHFLQHAENGRYRNKWLRLVGYFRTHEGGVETFRKVFGHAPSELREAWERHVMELREGN